MRVVVVSKALVVGAYQRKLEELAKLPGVELTAIVPPGWHGRSDSAPLDLVHTAGYNMVVAPVLFNGQHHVYFYPTLGHLLRRSSPDILHMDEEPYNLVTWQALRIGQAVGARNLFFTWQNLLRRYPWPFWHFESANYRRATYAIAGNQAAASVLRTKGYRGPLAVIPQFGVDPDIFRPLTVNCKSPIGLRDSDGMLPSGRGDFAIGYAGRLVPEKGVDVLLRACVALPFRSWSVYLLGDGPERARLATLSQNLGIGSKVQFLGRRPSTQIPDFYRMLDVLVVPSLTRPNWVEQFGRVLIEAMACEVPVIGSSSGEIPHVIADAGLVFPEGDPLALRDAIVSLAGDPAQHKELAERGRERVLAHFTHARVAAATAGVYQEMLRDHWGTALVA